LFSGFAQDEILLRQNLSLTLGTKLEHNDYTGSEWEPSGRLRWNFSPPNALGGGLAAVRTLPALTGPGGANLSAHSISPEHPVGGPDFASETVIAYELGHRPSWAPSDCLAFVFL